MNKVIDRLRIVFLIVFAVACAGVWAYQILYVWPQKRCAREGKWWAPKYRTCARVVYLPKMTGRQPVIPKGTPGPPDPKTAE